MKELADVAISAAVTGTVATVFTTTALALLARAEGRAPLGETLAITGVAFGSYAKRIGLDVGYDVVGVLRKADQPSSLIPIGLALALTGAIAGLQFMRLRRAPAAPTG